MAAQTLTAKDQVAEIAVSGRSSVLIEITSVTNVTMVFEAWLGKAWTAVAAANLGTGTAETGATAAGLWRLEADGLVKARVRASAVGATPTATVVIATGSRAG